MTRPPISCIQRTCPDCGVSNTVLTPEVRPSWAIHCSSCGSVLVERRGFPLQLVRTFARDPEPVRATA